MNQEAYSLIKGALSQKRQGSNRGANRDTLLSVLEQERIKTDMNMKPIEFLMRMMGKPCFPRGELVAVTGKAKSGKTFFTSMLMAACTADGIEGIERLNGLPPLKCLWYDTEQSRQSTLEILKERIVPLAGDRFAEELYDVFNVRSCNWEQRLDMLEVAVSECRPDLVVVDNVCDLIHDINDSPGNKVVMERLMLMAQTYDCCIVIVIHQNKGGEDRNPRGSIGTEALNKSFEVYACELLKPQFIFAVEQTHSRKHRWDDLYYFIVNEMGMPVHSDAPETVAVADSKEKYPPLNKKYVSWVNDQMQVDLRALFYDVLKTGVLHYQNLMTAAMGLLGCKNTGYWNNLFAMAKNQGIIVNLRSSENKSVWALAPKAVSESGGQSPS